MLSNISFQSGGIMASPISSNLSVKVCAQKEISRARLVPSLAAAASMRANQSSGNRTGIGLAATHIVYRRFKNNSRKTIDTVYQWYTLRVNEARTNFSDPGKN